MEQEKTKLPRNVLVFFLREEYQTREDSRRQKKNEEKTVKCAVVIEEGQSGDKTIA